MEKKKKTAAREPTAHPSRCRLGKAGQSEGWRACGKLGLCAPPWANAAAPRKAAWRRPKNHTRNYRVTQQFHSRGRAHKVNAGRSLTIWATREAPGWVLQTPIIPPAPFVEDTKPHSLKTWSSIHWSHEAPFIEDVKLHSLRGRASKEPMSGMERPKSTYWFTFKQSTTSRVVRATYYEAWLIMWPEY